MASLALGGTLREKSKIRIGFVRLFVGDVGTSYDKTVAFDTSTPTTGWRDLGATTDETAVEATKEVFNLQTGVLRTVKFQGVIGLAGRMTANLHEYDAVGVYQALGAALPFNVLAPSPTGSGIASVTSKTSFTLASGQGASYAVGDRIVVDLAANHTRSLNTSVIKSIATDAIVVDPALYVLPTTSMTVRIVLSRKNAAGTTDLPHFAMLAVHDFGFGGGQVCYHFPEVAFAAAGFRPNFAGGRENVKLALEATAFGVTDSDFSDTVVFTIHDFDA